MKAGSYFIVLLLGVVCVGLSVALVLIASSNQQLQARLEEQRRTLSGGVLGPQGQQISAGVLSDLAAVAATNMAVRSLLDKHGYRLQNQNAPATGEGDKP